MAYAAFAVSVFIALLGVLALVSPERFTGIARRLRSRVGLYIAAGFRLVFGGIFYLAADDSRAPEVFHFLGVLFIVAGLLMPLFGTKLFFALLDWWLARGPGFIRAWGVVALGGGFLLAQAVLP